MTASALWLRAISIIESLSGFHALAVDIGNDRKLRMEEEMTLIFSRRAKNWEEELYTLQWCRKVKVD